jgi:hypothetical protein
MNVAHQGPSRERSTRKSENENLIAGLIMERKKFVSSTDVLTETLAERSTEKAIQESACANTAFIEHDIVHLSIGLWGDGPD